MTKKKVPSLAEDLLSVYKELGGRDKLVTLAKDDQKFLKALLMDHMRLQSREKELELLNQRGPQKTALLIIKGLNDTPAVAKVSKDMPPEVLRMQSSLSPDRTMVEEVMEQDDPG